MSGEVKDWMQWALVAAVEIIGIWLLWNRKTN